SPFPCPFNYGRVEGYMGNDGDPLDAILLGKRLPYNSRHHVPVIGVVRFMDAGEEDHKWIFSHSTPSGSDARNLRIFFTIYAQIKNLTRLLHFKDCSSRLLCIDWNTKEIDTH
ncbi:MAG: inorganic pyrophosphatase, partial [Deltaproteobacteria bacterium]|nr:inorganic pyrophosphatase [Deltaproteobacteria bacterium]